MKTTYKLGEIIKTDIDQKIKRTVSETIETLPKGSELLVTRTGFKVLSRECRGAILPLNGKEIKGADYSNISKLIFNRINGVFELETYLEDDGIEYNQVVEEIEDVLMDIL